MSTSISYTDGSSLASIVFDAAVNQTHTHDADVTEHPVEGTNLTDNVRVKNTLVRVEGVFVDNPLAGSGKDSNGNSPTSARGRALDAYQRLLKLHSAGTPVRLISSLAEYENMVVKTVDVPRDAANTRGQVRLNVAFQQVRISDQLQVPIQRAATRTAQSKVDGGRKAGVTTDGSLESDLFRIKESDTAKGIGSVGEQAFKYANRVLKKIR